MIASKCPLALYKLRAPKELALIQKRFAAAAANATARSSFVLAFSASFNKKLLAASRCSWATLSLISSKWWIFHGYVSFTEGKLDKKPIISKTPKGDMGRSFTAFFKNIPIQRIHGDDPSIYLHEIHEHYLEVQDT